MNHGVDFRFLPQDFLDYTIRSDPGTRLTLQPSASRIELPVVGGAAALGL